MGYPAKDSHLCGGVSQPLKHRPAAPNGGMSASPLTDRTTTWLPWEEHAMVHDDYDDREDDEDDTEEEDRRTEGFSVDAPNPTT